MWLSLHLVILHQSYFGMLCTAVEYNTTSNIHFTEKKLLRSACKL